MKAPSLWLMLFVTAGAFVMTASPGCDNSVASSELALPGVGPIGAGGAPFGGGGAGGAAGTGGLAGTGGTAGAAGTGGAAGAAGQGGAGGSAPVCPGSGHVRIAALIPSGDALDFCQKSPADADFSKATRLMATLGDADHTTLAYGEVTRRVALSGGVTLKAITASDPDCTGAGLGQIDLCFQKDEDLLVGILEGVSPPTFTTVPPDPAKNRLRFVHAYVGAGALDVGIADNATLPAGLATVVLPGVTYGTTAKMGLSSVGPVLATGYLEQTETSGMPPIGIAPAGGTMDLLVAQLDLSTLGHSFTAFGIGRMADDGYPLKALVCDETKEVGALTACAVIPP